MKFKVREGFVCRVMCTVPIGGGQTQQQEASYYGGQVVDFDDETAQQHGHKLDPVCDAAADLVASWVLPAAPAPDVPVLGQQQLQELASLVAQRLMSGQVVQLPAQAAK